MWADAVGSHRNLQMSTTHTKKFSLYFHKYDIQTHTDTKNILEEEESKSTDSVKT